LKNLGQVPQSPEKKEGFKGHYLSCHPSLFHSTPFHPFDMSFSEQAGIESAVEAEVNDPLTSTVLDDMDSSEILAGGSSANLLESNNQDDTDNFKAQDNTDQSTLHLNSDLLIEEVSPYDNQQWGHEDAEFGDDDDMPDISLGGTTAHEPKPEAQPKFITDPTHAEVLVLWHLLGNPFLF
jgi:hypothetical protein